MGIVLRIYRACFKYLTKNLLVTGLAVVLCIDVTACGNRSSETNQQQIGYQQSAVGSTKVPIQAIPRLPVNTTNASTPLGTAPAIVIDAVLPYTGQVHPDGSGIYQPVTQSVYGRVFNTVGIVGDLRVVVYAATNMYYIQPLTNAYCLIANDTSWNVPSNSSTAGIVAFLVTENFQAPQTYPLNGLPTADGMKILAISSVKL